MAGGNWTQQNKVRPGVYINFMSAPNYTISPNTRGVVAICEPMSWGPVGQVMTVAAGADTTPYCGYPLTDPNAKFLQEIFRGTNRTNGPYQVLLYRPSASASAAATVTSGNVTATALYPGARGNDITIVITEDADNSGYFFVYTVVDGEIQDQQYGQNVSDLVANDWVTFTGTGALAATTGSALIGGADGTVQSAAYSTFLENIEPYSFDILIYDGTDSTVQTAMISFVERIASDSGQYCQLVASGLTNPNSRFVINVGSGVTLSDGTQLSAQQTTWWVGGAEAGAQYNESLTYAQYPTAVAVSPVMTNTQIITGIQSGQLLLTADGGTVQIETDINSLTTYTQDIGKAFRKNRVMRLCNTLANSIYQEFTANYIGVVNNNDNGRMLFKAAIVSLLTEAQAAEAIQNFDPTDVEVLPGNDIDSIVVNLAIQSVDATEKIYMTITVS